MELTPQQEKAVRHMGPALVVAGAGSGKTRTLTAKIAWLIEHGYRPENILAITFTNKAADEMKRRLVAITGLPLNRFPWVRTYHSACFKILKTDCTRLGYVPPIQIYSDYQQQKILKELLIRHNLERKQLYPLRAAISNAKNSGNPDSYFDAHPRVGTVRLADAYKDYEAVLREKNAVDFDNILLMTRNLLKKHEDLRQRYRSLFSYILVDEYQDTNNLQEELTRLFLENGNIFCVGDDWQAIYGFRGSNVSHFLSFQKTYPKACIFRLEQNFRSADEIVETAGRLISHNRMRMDKDCFSEKKGGTVEIRSFFSDDEEASWVSGKINQLNRDGVAYGNMAVLYRTKFCSFPYERTFRMDNIPYRMLGGKGFFERKEILDINCYLISAVFEKDDAAFERIINTPRRGIGPKMINRINSCRKVDDGLQAAAGHAVREKMLSPKVHQGLSDLLQVVEDIREMKPADAIREVLERMGYEAYLQAQAKSPDEFTARIENLEQLIHAASQYENLLAYLEEAALIREDREDDEQSGSGVNLATIHASKGLEFTAVFVIGCEENLLPHWKSVDTDRELSEERRLMYVAMTRAETHLYITSSGYRKGQYNPRSRFIDEING
ncbi:MAG: UvrD-helicase domain-containing protein [Deltaproteobacteria bacterium]|nr:UvrD-helicase domain-containing protein [Deltaproteobacteria bacterium]